MLGNNPEGWEGGPRGVGGRSKSEEIHVYIELIDFVVQQNLTQHCKAIILRLKRKEC